jgi:uncharacterized damage-inducible protein DinB
MASYLDHFRALARYTGWANERLNEAIAALDPEAFGRDCGVFFKSIKGTLNHLLVADRIWLHRFTGEGPTYPRLDLVLHEEAGAFAEARRAEDRRILAYVEGLTEQDLAGEIRYHRLDGTEHRDPLAPTLTHFFNHQTHHRGQAHACLTEVAGRAPALDFLYFLRESRASA